jgi:hypothetical protein
MVVELGWGQRFLFLLFFVVLDASENTEIDRGNL